MNTRAKRAVSDARAGARTGCRPGFAGPLRHGVGTLLITVLAILGALFIIAMMQHFASSITRGKRFLHHIAVTDYAADSALAEAIALFKATVNDPGSKNEALVKAIHDALVSGSQPPSTTFAPKNTRDVIHHLNPAVDISDVTVTVSNKTEIGSGKMKGHAFHENKGLISFTVKTKYETTKKTATRSLEFRQVVLLPPKEFPEYTFLATRWNYLGRRIRKYFRDQDAYRKSLTDTVQRIYFGTALLHYIVDPNGSLLGFSAPEYKAGIPYAKAVENAARNPQPNPKTFPGKPGQCPCWSGSGSNPLTHDLADAAHRYGNPKITYPLVDKMARSGSEKLKEILTGLQGKFKFEDSAATDLNVASEKYPLYPTDDSKKGKNCSEFIQPYKNHPMKRWGLNGKLKDDFCKPIELKFGRLGAAGQTESGQSVSAHVLSNGVIAGGVPSSKPDFNATQAWFKVRPPPILPPAAPPPRPPEESDPVYGIVSGSTGPTGRGSGGTGPTAAGSTLQLERATNVDDEIKEFLAERFDDYDQPVKAALADRGKFELPAISVAHPVSRKDWFFRVPDTWYDTKFDRQLQEYKAWETQTEANLKEYERWMTTNNAAFTGSAAMVEVSLSADQYAIPKLETQRDRASYRFPTSAEFKTVMGDLKASLGTQSLVMDGVYLIKERQGGAAAGPVEIAETSFVGQGAIVADQVNLGAAEMKKANASANAFVVWSADESKTFKLGAGEYHASFVVGGPFKGTGSKIHGILVVGDTLCNKADNAADDQRFAVRYRGELDGFTVKYPAWNHPYEASHMTFSPYRSLSASKRNYY
jgi:hypothetical protein